MRNLLKDLMTKTTEEAILDGLTNLNKELDADEQEYKELEDKHVALYDKYKQAVLDASFKPNGKEDLTRGSGKARSFEEIAAEVIKKNKEK